MVALFVLLTIITLLTIDYFVQRAELKKARAAGLVAEREPAAVPVVRPIAAVDDVPAGVFLDPGHVWAQLEPSGALRVGLDRMPIAVLGRPDRIEVRSEGTSLRKGDPLVTLFRGHRKVVLRSPADGIVTRVNAEADPDRLQSDPYGRGWLYWLTPQDVSPALKRMFVAEEAKTWAREQLAKLREFLAVGAHQGELVGATIQDGGALVEGLSDQLDDERWNRLVEEFFPAAR
jgi:glycine cleavage system H protein